jgi:hypothetical protein
VLIEFDLWETKGVALSQNGPDGQPQGEPIKVAEYYAVSKRLMALPVDKFLVLRTENWIPVIYAHLLSLLLWPKLLTRAVQAQNGKPGVPLSAAR